MCGSDIVLCPVFTVGLRVEDNWSKLFDQHSRENPNSIRLSGQIVGATSPLEIIILREYL